MSARYSLHKFNKEGLVYFNLKIDNIYNNLPFTNGYGIATAKRGRIDIQTGEILEKQSSYKFAIDFFNVSSISLPIMFVEILEGPNNDINATQYGFCLKHLGSGTLFSQRVVFTPDAAAGTYGPSGNAPLPKAPVDNQGLQDFVTSPYYYAVYTFGHLLNLFNRALYNCWAAMVLAYPASSPTVPPYLFFDEPSGRICFILHQTYIHSPKAEIFWNSQTEKYIESLRLELQPAYFTGDQTNFTEFKLNPKLARPYEISSLAASFGLPSQSDIINPPGLSDVPFIPWRDIGTTDFYIMMQEYDSLFFWNNIKSLVFFTTKIAVAAEYLPITNNPNLMNSNRVATMTIASPSLVTTTSGPHNFSEGETIYITYGSYSVSGVPITTTTSYIARNVTTNTFQLYNSNNTPTNVTAFNPAVTMWAYSQLKTNIGAFNNPSRTILAYFDVLAQKGVDWRSNAYNQPDYRKFHDLNSNSALNGIDIDIFLQLNNGALIPYSIGINDSIDFKFVFRRNDVDD